MQNAVVSAARSWPAQTNLHPLFNFFYKFILIYSLLEVNTKKRKRSFWSDAKLWHRNVAFNLWVVISLAIILIKDKSYTILIRIIFWNKSIKYICVIV
jgi:hypothetical protein